MSNHYPEYRKLENGDIEVTDFSDFTAGWPKPIPVSERLPEFDTEILGFCINHWRRTWLCGERKEWIDGEFQSRGIPFPALARAPSHWLPLPPTP